MKQKSSGKILVDKAKIDELLSRGVEEIIDREHLEKVLISGKKLRVKFGIDPTSPDIHLGHTVPFRKLAQFQAMGHQIVLIIGDFTAKIGDPTGRSNERKPLTESDVKKNMKEYLAQAGKVINIKNTEIHYNSEWHETEGLAATLEMARAATFQQIIKRADFQKRIEAGNDITILEILYPLFQGYDSVKVNADIEVGGSDQKFNLLMGRRVQRHFGQAEQDILTLPLLEGTDGVQKMSKSYGNYVGISEPPNEMFGKIMTIPDSLIEKYFVLLTNIAMPKKSPYEAKMILGETIVADFHSTVDAKEAREEWLRVFSKKERPEDAPKLKVKEKKLLLLELVVLAGIGSKSEARRLIEQNAVKINDVVKKDINEVVVLKSGDMLRVGKHRFFEIA
ncbi:MAG: tyrosine--tRNA ligase [Patescibacteria group bacterium]